MAFTGNEIALHNGILIPLCGLDTIELNKNTAYAGIRSALDNGIRHIETAADYGIEAETAKALEDCNIPRSSLFITLEINGLKNTDATIRSAEASIRRLGLDYIDLLLMAWNGKEQDHPDNRDVYTAWKALESLYKCGNAHAIGIVDFAPWQVEYLLQEVEIAPMVSLTGIYPGHPDIEILESNKEHRILTMAYLPHTIQKVISSKEISILAEKHSCKNEDIILQYLCQKECAITTVNGKLYHQPCTLSEDEIRFLDLMKDYGAES
jgi:diketogulonate reductase-like aldo/keto reductase